MAVANILNNLSTGITKIGKENSQFRQAAAQQNNTISKFIRDISKIFTSQSKAQGDINESLSSLSQSTVATQQKVDQTNFLLNQSISIQTQMYNELKGISSTMDKLLEVSSQNTSGDILNNNNGGGISNMMKFLGGFGGGALLGSALLGTTAGLEQNFGSLVGMIGGQGSGTVPPAPTNVGFGDTGGGRDQGGGGKLTVAEMVKLAKEAGFDDREAAIMGAIGAAESSGRTSAHNPNASTGDNSYGLWQINMLGNMGPARREQFGISSNEQLFDPKINAMAAKKIYDQQGFNAWSVYKSGAYQKYLGTAYSALKEGDDSMAPQGTIVEKEGAMSNAGGGSVQERQAELAGVRKLPLSPTLRGVLEKAAAAAGVDAVVYSGGQAPKGSGGPRTGSTRHDHGNAADLYLMRGGRKLSDTNPEDRAIMAKFVSAAVAAGATGVGAGHGYMGPSNIHVGFGKQATWGGAPWIKSAASGVYNNQNLASEGGGEYGGGSQMSGIPGVDGMMQSFSGMGGPAGLLGGMLAQQAASLAGNFSGLLGMVAAPLQAIGGAVGEGGFASYEKKEETMEGDITSAPRSTIQMAANEPSYLNEINNAALETDAMKFNTQPQQMQPTNIQERTAPPTTNFNRDGDPYGASRYSSSAPWYAQLGGKIHYNDVLKFKGGVFQA